MKRTTFVMILLFGFGFLLQAQTFNKLSRSERKNGWVLLFDGSTTEGWLALGGQPISAGWEIIDGNLTAVAGAKGGDIITQKEYADFELKLEYRIAPGCNSGIKYYFTRYDSGGDLGLEYQILDDKLGEDNKEADHLTGSLYDILPPLKLSKKLNPPGQWNSVRIVAKGNKIQHWLNDFKILEFEKDSRKFSNGVEQSKFNSVKPTFGSVKRGRILLQEHGGEVSFRNVKIRTL